MALVVAAFPLSAAAQSKTQKKTPTPLPPIELEAAIAQGLVTTKFLGTGGSSGDVIELRVRRTTARNLRLRVAAGMMLRSVGGAVQDMLIEQLKGEILGATTYRPTELIELPDGTERRYLIEAYCLDFAKDNPDEDSEFTLDSVDAAARAIVEGIPKAKRTTQVIQAALWLAQGVTEKELQERFPVSDDDLRTAKLAVIGKTYEKR